MRALRFTALIVPASLIFLLMPAAQAAEPATAVATAVDPSRPGQLFGVRRGVAKSALSGRIAAAHSYVVRVDRGLVPGRRTYGVAEIAILTQDQEQLVWCVPAATRAVLSAFVKNLPSQSYLALLEGTDDLGTYLDRVPAVLNHYQNRVRYESRNSRTLTEYREAVRTDVDVYRAPLILAIDPANAPWYRKMSLLSGSHAIVAYGYAFTPRFAGISVWDPSGLQVAGRQIAAVGDLWLAGNNLNHPVVW